MQKSKYIEFIENNGEEIKTNSKRFWSYIKSLKGLSSLPQVMVYGGIELKSYTDIANGFNNFFKSVFKQNAKFIPYCKTRDTPVFHLNNILPAEMLEELNNIKQNTSRPFSLAALGLVVALHKF